VPDSLNNLAERLSRLFAPVHRFAPLLASALTMAAGLCTVSALRLLMSILAIILFLWIAADFARSLMERETGFASESGPPKEIPVTAAQVGLTAMLGAMYGGMIIAGLHLMFLPHGMLFMFVVPAVFVIAGLAAWRNVRLWYRQGADYEQALREEALESHQVRIPPTA
jgi:hypothetical protein